MNRSTTRPPISRTKMMVSLSALLAGSVLGAATASASLYQEINLVTDDSTFLASQGYSPTTQPDDLNLINPWGMSSSPTSPIWVSDNNSGVATIYNGHGVKQGLTVNVVGANGNPANPTGQVFNSTSSFNLTSGGKAFFIFASEDGTISGWNGGANSQVMVGASGTTDVYKGLAIGTTTVNNAPVSFLYAANFNTGKVDVFDTNFMPATGFSFTDPSPPPVPPGTPSTNGWAPFNVQQLNGNLYVTYAIQNDAHHDDVANPGSGFVDEFDLKGNFIRRIATGGVLDSPWGLDIAPTGFGQYSGDLLVGNFGNGMINVFDPNATDDFLGTLDNLNGSPIVIGDLWGLINGNGGNGGDPNGVYFAAGVMDESHGLFGELLVPEPASITIFGVGLVGLMRLRRREQPPSSAPRAV